MSGTFLENFLTGEVAELEAAADTAESSAAYWRSYAKALQWQLDEAAKTIAELERQNRELREETREVSEISIDRLAGGRALRRLSEDLLEEAQACSNHEFHATRLSGSPSVRDTMYKLYKGEKREEIDKEVKLEREAAMGKR